MEEKLNLLSQLMAEMSHEIRTPLNGVLGFIEMLHTGYEETKEDHREIISLLNKSSKNVWSAFDDLITATMIIIHGINKSITKFDIFSTLEVIETSLNKTYWMCGGYTIEFILEGEQKEIWIEAHQRLIETMFRWFIGNQVIQSTIHEERSRFFIHVKTVEESVLIAISNVSEMEESAIKELYEGHSWTYLIEYIIEAHSGTLTYKPDGNGKTFAEISLPLKQEKE